MASDLYPNPDLTQESLNRQGSLEPVAPSNSDIMDSVFFSLENNTARIMTRNAKGFVADLQDPKHLDPEEIWGKYGVRVEESMSSERAKILQENQDDVANVAYNLSYLEQTLPNQLRVLANGMGGAMMTDPVNWALMAAGGGAGLAATRAAAKTPKLFNLMKNIAKVANTNRLTRVGAAGAGGVIAGYLESQVENAILLDQAPRAGLRFTEEDAADNTIMNMLFSGSAATLGRVGSEGFDYFRNRKAEAKVFKSTLEADADVKPAPDFVKVENYRPEVSGRKYTVHRSNDGNFGFNTQAPVGESNFGEGFQFSSSREWAFSDKGYSDGLTENVFEMDFENISVRLFDSEAPLPPELAGKLLEEIREELGLPEYRVLDSEMIQEGRVRDVLDALNSLDRKTGKDTAKILNKIIKDEGFQGYSFREGIQDVDGNDLEGIHLFEMPEGASVRNLSEGARGTRRPDQVEVDQTRAEQQRQLDYYKDQRNRIDYEPEIEEELEAILPNIPTDTEELNEITTMATTFREEADVLVSEIEEIEASLEGVRETPVSDVVVDLYEEFDGQRDYLDILPSRDVEAIARIQTLSSREIQNMWIEARSSSETGNPRDYLPVFLRNLTTETLSEVDIEWEDFGYVRGVLIDGPTDLDQGFYRDLLLGNESNVSLYSQRPTQEVSPTQTTQEVSPTQTTNFRSTNNITDPSFAGVSSKRGGDYKPTEWDKKYAEEISSLGDTKIYLKGRRITSLDKDGYITGVIGWTDAGIYTLAVSDSRKTSPNLAPTLITKAIENGAPKGVSGSISPKAARLANLMAEREARREARKMNKKGVESLKNTMEPEKAREVAKASDFCVRN